ncbi:hypothetical protein F5884DRAFT_802273 [Xylogone sp. PMI_703]|nr:hypothetical protein F5884DRAFT_802273 [Xylogone sp. PMI_703]
MMPFAWVPEDGIDFFKQFTLYVEERWLRLCALAKDHLARLFQLKCKGTDPELITSLAEDAQKWADFRSGLQDQVQKSRDFAVEYSNRYNGSQTRDDIQQAISELESKVNSRIDELDQVVRDLLQIVSTITFSTIQAHLTAQEFAWVSLNETRTSTRLGQNVMLLTYVSIFYLPLGFSATLWAIPNITDRTTLNSFIITATIVGFVTFIATSNLKIIGNLYHGRRATLVEEMRNDDDWKWKELGAKLQAPNSNPKAPSDWWLAVYSVCAFMKRVVGKKRKEGDTESAT